MFVGSLEKRYSKSEILLMIEGFLNACYTKQNWTAAEEECYVGILEYRNHLRGRPDALHLVNITEIMDTIDGEIEDDV